MAITITDDDKRKFIAAIEKIGIMREIHTLGWMALQDPVNLYACIRCMEHVGELLNPAETARDSIFHHTPQVPWLRTARIRNLLGHKYYQDFTNRTAFLTLAIDHYTQLEKQLSRLIDATALDNNLLNQLSAIRYSNDNTDPNATFANELVVKITTADLNPDDLHTRLEYMLKTLTTLENIIHSPAPNPYEKIKKLLAIQRCLQVIGQIKREIPIEPYQQQITKHFMTRGQIGMDALVMWGHLYDIRIDIAHEQASIAPVEQLLTENLKNAHAVLTFFPTIQYIFDLNQRKLQLPAEIAQTMRQIQVFYTEMIPVPQEEMFDRYVVITESYIRQLTEFEAAIEELGRKINYLLIELSQLNSLLTQTPSEVIYLQQNLSTLHSNKNHISQSITQYQLALVHKKYK